MLRLQPRVAQLPTPESSRDLEMRSMLSFQAGVAQICPSLNLEKNPNCPNPSNLPKPQSLGAPNPGCIAKPQKRLTFWALIGVDTQASRRRFCARPKSGRYTPRAHERISRR